MKILAVVLVPFLCSAAAEIRPEIKSVIDLARGAPGEFAADALIRIAALDQIEKPLRVQLLTDAFQRAAEAQQPYKLRVSIPGKANSRFLSHAYEQDLDSLSLRMRAVQAMLKLDSAKAKQMLLDAPRLDLPKVPCEAFLTYDVSRFYETVEETVRTAFTASETAKGEPVHMLQQYLAQITSPAQVGPAANLLARAKVSNADFELLLAVYAGALSKTPEDDRSFTDNLAAGARIAELVRAARGRNTSPAVLIEAYRAYLVSHLTAVRCADDGIARQVTPAIVSPAPGPEDVPVNDAVGFFNKVIRMDPAPLIQDSETAPAKLEGSASTEPPCQSAGCQAIRGQFRDLVIGPEGTAYSDGQRKTSEWQEKLGQFLTAVAEWTDDGGGPGAAEQFREKCTVYGDVYGITPNGPGRELVLRSLLEYLQRSQSQAANRLEWFLPVNTLVGRGWLDPMGTGSLTDALRRAGNPVIVLYQELEAIAPRGPGVLVGLL